MVSGGTVNADAAKAKALLDQYISGVSGVAGSWKGASSNNLQAKAQEFYSSYSSAIAGQMSSFATACDLYAQYEQVKVQLQSARNSYNYAKSNNTGNESQYSTMVSNLQSKLDTLKQQIEAALASAGGTSLSASSQSTATDATTSGTDSGGTDTTTTTSKKDWTNDANFKYYSQGGGWNDYKFSGGGAATMKATGCGPTSMAMVLDSLGYGVNPNTAAEWSTEHGYHTNGTTEGYFTAYAQELGVQSKVLGRSSENIKTALQNNELVVLFVGPGDFTNGGHYIVARGYDASTNKILIADPDSKANSKWFDLDRVVGQLKGKQSSWSFTTG